MKIWILFAAASLSLAQEIAQLDAVIEAAIRNNELPGAVCLVGYRDRILHRKAYGQRALEPRREAMTLDTIFDAASLTKVVATTSSILRLVEDGKVRLSDRVTVYLPEFQAGKSDITIRNLLTHYSGLRPDLDLEPAWSGYDLGIQKALIDKPVGEPGVKFVYSDINFILLGEIVRRVSGKPLNEFARDSVFVPLGMSETGYLPPAEWKARIAPTEKLKGETLALRGVVHDETTRFMGGVAGHAGLFTTADDLAKFARMVLDKGRPVLSPLTIYQATRTQSPAGLAALRGLGWDIDSPFAGNRGDLYPIGSFGHTGFTGTSMWIDPSTESYVILMANAVHPMRRPPITPLRGRVASVAAAYVSRMRNESTQYGQVLTGLDRMVEQRFASLANKNVALVTNHTGNSREGMRNIDLMTGGGVKLKAIFSPEHGFQGKLDDEKVPDSRDEISGLPIYSLFHEGKRRPNIANLKGIDTIVFDIQDIGTRFYTYGCTMKAVMEVAAELNIEFVVLDRPNPISGQHVEGPPMETAEMSFVGCLPIPLRHGFTIGELARFANSQITKKVKLSVVAMSGWRRDSWFDQTGLEWLDPSPNMRNLNSATLYPGIGMLEYSKNYSVGRGTDAPFEQVGAPWIDGIRLAKELNAMNLAGVTVYPTSFTPTGSIYQGKKCSGFRFIITDRDRFDSTLFGLSIAQVLFKSYPKELNLEANRKLIGSSDTIRRLRSGQSALEIKQSWDGALANFRLKRQQYLIYP